MWIASKLGFYSVVAAGNEIMIRTRSRQDLANLQKATHQADSRIRFLIIRTPLADYPFRAIITGRAWQRVMGILGGTIDYPNFKSMISATPDQADKHDAYYGLWSALFNLQLRERGGRLEDSGMFLREALRPFHEQAFQRTEYRAWGDGDKPTIEKGEQQ